MESPIRSTACRTRTSGERASEGGGRLPPQLCQVGVGAFQGARCCLLDYKETNREETKHVCWVPLLYLPFSITAPKEKSLQTGNQKVTFRDTKRGIIGRTCFLVSFRGAFLRPKKEENIRWSRLGGEQFSQLFWRSGAGTELHLHTPPPFEDHKLQIPIRNWLTCPDPRPTGA